MQNYSKSKKQMKFKYFPKKNFVSSVHTKSFVSSMPNMNVIQRKKRTHLLHPDEIM